MTRRTLLGLTAMSAGCGHSGSRYFGRAASPGKQRLVMAIGAGPGTLDPGLSWDIWEPYAIRALFEGLIGYHQTTLEPVAALATHYERNSDHTQFTFYLRGHRRPGGMPLPGSAPERFTDPALWSDGKGITAHDFVYSWRRAIDPANGFPTAFLFYPIHNAQAINSGKLQADALGVRAIDDFAVQVDLREPAPYFVQLAASNQFFPVPRHAVEKAGSFSTRPGQMVSSGAFRLKEWRDGEVVLVKNPRFYDAKSVRLQELRLITISQPTTTINLYKAGVIDLLTPLLPALHVRLLKRAPDFHTHPAIANQYLVMNTRNWPFDHILVRYALNMAIDKKEIVDFRDSGPAAATLLPPLAHYEPPQAVPVNVHGRTCDILAFDPAGARSLMGAAGFPEWSRLKIEYLYPTQGNQKDRFEILQKQLRTSLGIELVPVPKESSIWNEETYGVHYRGISAWSDIGLYQDPTYFLDQFLTGTPANVTGWADSRYDAAVKEAKSSAEPAVRRRKFSNCEQILLEAMPVIPLYYELWQQLRKPYVRGIEANSIDAIAFHRAWIDAAWSPQ